jgi:hypothetical protein
MSLRLEPQPPAVKPKQLTTTQIAFLNFLKIILIRSCTVITVDIFFLNIQTHVESRAHAPLADSWKVGGAPALASLEQYSGIRGCNSSISAGSS